MNFFAAVGSVGLFAAGEVLADSVLLSPRLGFAGASSLLRSSETLCSRVSVVIGAQP